MHYSKNVIILYTAIGFLIIVYVTLMAYLGVQGWKEGEKEGRREGEGEEGRGGGGW